MHAVFAVLFANNWLYSYRLLARVYGVVISLRLMYGKVLACRAEKAERGNWQAWSGCGTRRYMMRYSTHLAQVPIEADNTIVGARILIRTTGIGCPSSNTGSFLPRCAALWKINTQFHLSNYFNSLLVGSLQRSVPTYSW